MAIEVTVAEAETQLSELIGRVEAGEEVVICRGAKPIARLSAVAVPAELDAPKQPRVLGRLRGLFVVPDDFNDDLPDDVLAAMEGDDPLDPLRDLRP